MSRGDLHSYVGFEGTCLDCNEEHEHANHTLTKRTTDLSADFVDSPTYAALHGAVFMVGSNVVEVHLGLYSNGRLAVVLHEAGAANEAHALLGEERERYARDNYVAGEVWAKLTVNVDGEALQDGEVFVKTYGENEATAAAALRSGLFEDTGRRVPTGYASAQVWRVVVAP